MSEFLKEMIRMQSPGYAQRQYDAEDRQRRELERQENARLLQQYIGSQGTDPTAGLNEFGDEYLTEQGVSLPSAVEGYGYLGSDQSDQARLQFASNLLSMPESASQARAIGADVLAQYMRPTQQQELVGKLKEYRQAMEMGAIPPDMSYSQFMQLGKAAGVTVNTGSGDPGYIPGSDLTRYVDAEGNHPAPGTTYGQLYGEPGRYQVATAEGQKQQRNEQNLVAMVDEANDQLFGEQGLAHNLNQSGGPVGVLTNAARAKYQQLSQTDPRYKIYDDWRTGTGSQLLKSLGVAGSLSDDDVKRGLALLPDPASDSVSVMEAKMRYLYKLAGKASPTQGQSQSDPLGIR